MVFQNIIENYFRSIIVSCLPKENNVSPVIILLKYNGFDWFKRYI